MMESANYAIMACSVKECVQTWNTSPALTLYMGTLRLFFSGKVVALDDAECEEVQELSHVGGMR